MQISSKKACFAYADFYNSRRTAILNIIMNTKNTVRSMLAASLIVAGAATLWAGTQCSVPENFQTTSDKNSPKSQKQCLCHNAGPNAQKKTLCLPPGAYQAHINNHQDTPGPCPNGR